MSNTATLPKSLHTVSVLVNVARALADAEGRVPAPSHVLRAVEILGYDPMQTTADPHGLVAVAMRKVAGPRG